MALVIRQRALDSGGVLSLLKTGGFSVVVTLLFVTRLTL